MACDSNLKFVLAGARDEDLRRKSLGGIRLFISALAQDNIDNRIEDAELLSYWRTHYWA